MTEVSLPTTFIACKYAPKALEEKHFTRENAYLGNHLNILSPNEYFLALGHYSLFSVQLAYYINLKLVWFVRFWWLIVVGFFHVLFGLC